MGKRRKTSENILNGIALLIVSFFIAAVIVLSVMCFKWLIDMLKKINKGEKLDFFDFLVILVSHSVFFLLSLLVYVIAAGFDTGIITLAIAYWCLPILFYLIIGIYLLVTNASIIWGIIGFIWIFGYVVLIIKHLVELNQSGLFIKM